MKLNIPYYKQININECGVVASKMILEYFDIKVTIEELKQKIKLEQDRPLLSTEVLLLLNKFGLKSSLYTNDVSLNKNIPNYYNDILLENLKEIEKLQLYIFIDVVNIDFIKECIVKNKPVIALLNQLKFDNKHFTPVTGFDNEHIYIHDINEESKPIKNEKFNFMLNSNSMDRDLIVVEEINL